MKDEITRLIQQMVEQERTRSQTSTLRDNPSRPAGIPCSELPEDASDEPLAQEWNVYRQEVARLLAEGQEGRCVLIKGKDVIGLFDDWKAAPGGAETVWERTVLRP